MLKSKRFHIGAALLVGLLLVSLIVTLSLKSSAAKASPAAIGANWYNAAPYVMPLSNNPPDLPSVMASSGAKAFTLAFVLANNGCTAAWGGDAGMDNVSSDTQVGPIIDSVRAAGGDVVVSFGGYNGTKLGQDCSTPQATADAEQVVINKYALKAIDLDLEEPEYENATAINNELGAAQILQQNNSGLNVSITIPGTTSGTGFFGQQLLTNAKTLNYTPNTYSIMPFDGGFSGASSQITALQDFHTMLMNTFAWDSATAYAHEGISSMNGRTDSAEFFTQTDFQTVLNFATSNHLARYTFWAVNRDRQCNPPDNNGSLSGTCSSVPQGDWDFTKIIVAFAGATPPPTGPAPTPPTAPTVAPTTAPVPTPTSAAGTGSGSCSGVAAWSSTTTYVGGNEATYNGSLWKAQWWSYNDVPGGAAGVWVVVTKC